MSRFQLVFLVFVSSVALSACEENKFMTPGDDVDQGTDNVAADASTTSPDAGQGVDTYVAADVNQIDSSTNIDLTQSADVAQQADSGSSPDVAQQADIQQGTDAAMVGTDAESVDAGIKPDVDVNTADVQVNNDVATDANVLCQIVSNCGGWKNGCCICKGAWLYPDLDHDSYGQAQINATWGCADQTNKDFVLVSGDCNDNMMAVHPGATEVCFNNIDDNCNGQTDENCQPQATYCMDYDNDTYVVADGVCVLSNGQAFGDCDNFNAAIYPGATEVCNNADDNCDGLTDEYLPINGVYLPDADKDGYGDKWALAAFACMAPVGYVSTEGSTGDCNDKNALINPGEKEVCGNNIDDNCDGQTDEGCSKCVPTGMEVCDGKDNNCDGQTDEGFNIGQACTGLHGVCAIAGKMECGKSTDSLGSFVSICSVEAGQSLSQAVTEVCGDNLDNDCDGVTDNGCVKNNSIECKLLGGVNGSDGYCKTFCDSCKAFQTCLDVNKDGIADTCEDPPTDGGYFPEEGLIALRFKNLGYVPSNIVGTVHYYKSLSDYTNLSGWDPVDFGSFFDALNFYAFTELGQKFNDPNKAPDVCGMQFNAAIFKNGVATDWLCEGSGTLAHVIDNAQILYLHHDVLIDITKRVTVWKDPNQNGCNVTIPDSETCPLQTPKP